MLIKKLDIDEFFRYNVFFFMYVKSLFNIKILIVFVRL